MPKSQDDQAIRLVISRERVRGIEPPFSAWEADVLPLNYTRRTDTTIATSLLRATFKLFQGSVGCRRDPGVTLA